MIGELQVRVGNENIVLRTGDVLHIGANEPHQFTNSTSEYAKFLCIRDFV
jgi:quercetin dioxygenase-like cupin family protein